MQIRVRTKKKNKKKQVLRWPTSRRHLGNKTNSKVNRADIAATARSHNCN